MSFKGINGPRKSQREISNEQHTFRKQMGILGRLAEDTILKTLPKDFRQKGEIWVIHSNTIENAAMVLGACLGGPLLVSLLTGSRIVALLSMAMGCVWCRKEFTELSEAHYFHFPIKK